MKRSVLALVVTGALALVMVPSSVAGASPRAGQSCAPKGGTYRTATATLLCAPALRPNGKPDTTYRWRNITGPAGPRGAQGPRGIAGPACSDGYLPQLIQVQAIPTGATDPAWVKVMACVALAVPTETPTPTATTGLDPRFPTCTEAKAAGYGPYRRGVDPEYYWYEDRDQDGIDCE